MLIQELIAEKIKAMKEPVIFMNEVDVKKLKDYVESNSTIKCRCESFKFCGVPIKESKVIEVGTYRVFDNFYFNMIL